MSFGEKKGVREGLEIVSFGTKSANFRVLEKKKNPLTLLRPERRREDTFFSNHAYIFENRRNYFHRILD